MIKKIALLLTSISVLVMPFSAFAKTKEGLYFELGTNAAQSGNLAVYRQNRDKIKSPHLKSLLYGVYLEKNIDTVSSKEVSDYLSHNNHLYKARSIRQLMLQKHMDNADWARFDKTFDLNTVTDSKIRCVWLNRRGNKFTPSTELVETLWLTTDARPDECDSLFISWQKKGVLSHELIKQRALAAIAENKPKLTSYVANTFLSGDDKTAVLAWSRARYAKSGDQMAKAILDIAKSKDTEMVATLISEAFDFQARKSPNHAYNLWLAAAANNRVKGHYADVMSGIASRAVLMEARDSEQWVSRATKLYHEVASEVAVRDYLRQQKWPQVLATIKKMPMKTQETIDWQYWLARALEKNGDAKEAKKIYEKLAKEREFFGFLAADRLGQKYQFNHNPPAFAHAKALASDKKFQAVKALLDNGLYQTARTQWSYATIGLNDDELASAAKVASEWNFNDRAIITAGQAQAFDAIDIRFPRAYQTLVEKAAEANNLKPEFVFAIIRQESAFMDQVESHAGALGLMQIMPATGKHIAKKQSLKNFSTNDLLSPEKNIAMGAYYMSSRLSNFNNQYPVAIASYNAGASNANRWLPKNKVDADVWVETITFRETRKYVKRVLEYTMVYRHLMGKDDVRVSTYLGDYVRG